MEQLIAQVKKGSQTAFKELMQDWYPHVYQFAWKYFAGGSRTENPHNPAEEVAQRTFISVHKNIEKLREPSRFKSWLFRIAANYCYEEDRRNKTRDTRYIREYEAEDSELKQMESTYAGPYRHTLRKDISHWVLRALDQLAPEQRAVLILKEYQGLKFREIAEALEISENTAKSRLYAGLQHMRLYLERKQITQDSLRYDF